MELKIFDSWVTKDEKTYLVSSLAELDGKEYYLMVNEFDESDVKICSAGDAEKQLIVSKDTEVNMKLLPLFHDALIKFLEENPELKKDDKK